MLSVLLVEDLLLISIKHYLVDTLSKEVLVEPAVNVFGVGLIEDFYKLIQLKLLQNLDYGPLVLVAEG